MNISQMNSVQHAKCLRQPVSKVKANSKLKHAKEIKFNNSKKLSIVFASVLAFSPLARAALPPGLEVFSNMQEVSDSELGHMRGKFASNNQVMYFGVEIVSKWLTDTGKLVTAGANLNIDFHGAQGNTPTVHFEPTVTIVQQTSGANSTQNNGNNGVSGGAGLANVSGVSQSIQVAGRSNSINNGIDMHVDLSPAGSAATAGGGSQGQAGLTSASQDGTVATVTLANNSIGVNIAVPGQGQVLQQIRNQGMFQSARIGGDFNQINNMITMHIGINSSAGVGDALAALQNIKNLPQNGMF
jgi:hypothetical protein